MEYKSVRNGETVSMNSIPVLDYPVFFEQTVQLLQDPARHCLNYYAYKEYEQQFLMLCCMADDSTSEIYLYAYRFDARSDANLESLTAVVPGLHCFEREISENYGIRFAGQPWDKPLRFAHDRNNKSSEFENYPFYNISGHELHEVGVGPIHAGIIEPGHFRFICNGEKVLHLEIHLGYQHRGIEQMMLQKKSMLERTLLAESIAGDSVAANTTAFAMLTESLGAKGISEETTIARTLAIELERAAIHTGDLSALCTDIAYQLGSSVFQGLRTTLINTFLGWCGNRFARRLIRPCHNPFPVTSDIKALIRNNLDVFEPRFDEMADFMFNIPGVLARFDDTGHVTQEQAALIHAVGMAARTCGIARDIRSTHPYGAFKAIKHIPFCLDTGDVHARALLRRQEVTQSLEYIREMLDNCNEDNALPVLDHAFMPSSFSIAVTEGWRGEHVHCAITDKKGDLAHYKIKDPSMHNWMALALAVRKNDISDFPVCNKSFNLSYCGYDL